MGELRGIKALLTISDTHCGSDVGLMPPPNTFKLYDGAGNTQNPLQKIMWEVYQDHLKQALLKLKGVPFVLVLNGDMVDGVHHKSTEALVKVIDHSRCAVACLKPIANEAIRSGGKVVMVMGTECHTNRDEQGIGKELGCVSPKDRQDLYAFDGVDMTINGVLVNALHHISTTSRAYLEASGLSISMGNAILNRARDKQPVPQVFLRAHRHTAGFYSDGRSLIAVQGAYQFKTRYGNKVVPDSGTFPSMTVLDWRNKKNGELPAIEMIGTPITQIESITL